MRLLDHPAARVVAQVEPVGLKVLVEPAGFEVVGVEHPGERRAAEEHVLGVGAAGGDALAVRARVGRQECGGHKVLA